MSKLLTSLEAQLAQASDEAARAELIARKASYLARIGLFTEAEGLISQVRERFGDGRSVRVSVLMMLAEGLLHTFRDISDVGADRIMRANALANATRDRGLISATSAWRAFTQSERSEFKGMARSLDNSFANSESEDHEVLARLYMILANGRMSIGDRAVANDLYMYSRHHALECGDQATIDALIYNRAAFALAWLRAQACFGRTDSEQLRLLRLELASAKTYQQMVGVSALSNFVYLWEARLLSLSEEFEAAIAALRAVRSMRPFAQYNYHASLIDLEVGYCQLQLGRNDQALEEVRESINTDLTGLHDDDKLVAASIRATLYEAFPQLGDARQGMAVFEDVGREFNAGCLELRNALDSLSAHPHIVRPRVVQPKASL